MIDVGWGFKAEGVLMRFASERCSARSPGRGVKSAPGMSDDVLESMEDRVSVMISMIAHQYSPE